MTLQNLLKIGRLKPHAPTPQEIQRLLAAAERNLADAGAAAISDETRFDAAYKAVMQLAMVAMMANGYRPATNEPGHLKWTPKTGQVDKLSVRGKMSSDRSLNDVREAQTA